MVPSASAAKIRQFGSASTPSNHCSLSLDS
jgi:hypothetical protein